MDSHAFRAAATFGLLGFRPFRKRSAPGDGVGVGGAVGLVVGMASPWSDMQLRKASNAWPKPPRPNPPAGRSDAHASRAFCIVGFGVPLGNAVGRAVGRAVGTVTPCCRRQAT